jgi:hypothetical protein
MAEYEEPIDTAARATHRATIERAAQAAVGGTDRSGLSATPDAVEAALRTPDAGPADARTCRVECVRPNDSDDTFRASPL